MLLSNHALSPTENSAVAHCWAMAHKLKTSGVVLCIWWHVLLKKVTNYTTEETS